MTDLKEEKQPNQVLGFVVLSIDLQGKYYINYLKNGASFHKYIKGNNFHGEFRLKIEGTSPISNHISILTTNFTSWINEDLIGTSKELTPFEFKKMLLDQNFRYHLIKPDSVHSVLVLEKLEEYNIIQVKLKVSVGPLGNVKMKWLADNHPIHLVTDGKTVHYNFDAKPVLEDHQSLVKLEARIMVVREHSDDVINYNEVSDRQIYYHLYNEWSGFSDINSYIDKVGAYLGRLVRDTKQEDWVKPVSTFIELNIDKSEACANKPHLKINYVAKITQKDQGDQ